MLLVLAWLTVLAGCASGRGQISDVQRLQARAAFERALKHIDEREPVPAFSALREAVALDGANAPYRDMLGLVLLQLQHPDLAAEVFAEAVRLDPAMADAHFHLGTALAESWRWAEAVASYRRALALPTLTVPHLVHQNLGLALYHLRRFREAEESLRFALSLEPEMGMAYYNLGLLFLAEGRRDEARAVLERARQLGVDPALVEAAVEKLKGLGSGG